MWPNDADGNAIRANLGPLLAKGGYKILDPGAYQDGTTDYSSQIAFFKKNKCQIFNTFPIPPDFTTFWRLIVPMSVPALASFAIFQFLWVWNDLLVALLFLGQGENQPLTVNLAGLVGSQGQGWQLLTAGAFVTMVVPLVIFISLQRYFIRGMTSGSVKG